MIGCDCATVYVDGNLLSRYRDGGGAALIHKARGRTAINPIRVYVQRKHPYPAHFVPTFLLLIMPCYQKLSLLCPQVTFTPDKIILR